jgi:hypothetical protein
MQARLIVYLPDAAALIRWLAPEERLRIGRSRDCGLFLDQLSISRHHAEIFHDGQGWRLHDLGSKNGSFSDGTAVGDVALPAACWLRFGDVHCEFAQFDAGQAEAMRGRERERYGLSVMRAQQVAMTAGPDALLDEVLRGVAELAGCDRGFMLLADGDDFAVVASLVLAPAVLDKRAFSGSVGAVQRALATGRPVVVNQLADAAWLAERASVIGTGLQCLVCMPLLDGVKVIGAVYADRRGPGVAITDVDLELLAAFTETATLWLLARHALRKLDDAPRWNTIVQGQAIAAARSGGASP